MKTVADPLVFASLVTRLQRLSVETPRRWGTLTAHEMFCHLADSTDMVLRVRPRDRPMPHRRRRVLKLLGLWTPIRWPHGWRTNPMQDPHLRGTRPREFERDRQRTVESLRQLSAADSGPLEPAHGVFGLMTVRDWQRWAYKHTDHHLRQFGQ